MRSLWLAGFALASCVESKAVDCGDGRFCPPDYTCKPNLCVSPAQMHACEGASDGDACTAAGASGKCFDGACVSAFCGNGVMEPGEACDDGNQRGGDGCNGTCTSDESCGNGIIELAEECDPMPADPAKCDPTTCLLVRCGNGVLEAGEVCDDGNRQGGDHCSFDCLSLEVCGNGILDPYAGELCEDSNTRDFDGCSSTCQRELLQWTVFDQTSSPPQMGLPGALVYDARRDRVVMFGGEDSTAHLQRDTWELDRTTWEQRVLDGPTGRDNASIAYDPKRGRIVMFGGLALQGYTNETWEFDGIRWTKIATASQPSPRINARLVYDSARNRMVLFGGVFTTTVQFQYNDTWEYNGTTWTQITTANQPTQRAGTTMAYDPKRNKVVLWSGSFGPPPDFNSIPSDLWEYDGTNWMSRTISGTLPPAGVGRMTFDQTRGKLVLLDTTDTWTFDGTGWQKIATGSEDWSGSLLYFDPYRDHLVRIKGPTTNPWKSEELLAGTWTLIDNTQIPTQRVTPAVFDSKDGKAIMFSGESGAISTGIVATNDTWELTGRTWRKVTTTGTPAMRAEHVLGYDADRGVVVMFGGIGSGGTMFNQTYEYNPTTHAWSQPTLSGSPPSARVESAMVYDAARKRMVMFGGMSSAGYLAETWEYDGTAWTQITTSTTPEPRYLHAMAFDSRHNRVVMFGGISNVALTNDTWVYDGTNWAKLAVTNPPPLAANQGMTYDAGRDRIVLHGGGGATSALNDTWELQDTTWSQYTRFATQPTGPAASQPALVYDTVRRRAVLIGSFPVYNGSETTPDNILIAEFAPLAATPPESCSLGFDLDGDGKAGCADDDCWGICSPSCAPTTMTCPSHPKCGDGMCDPLESCRTCAADCAACTAVCGDRFCDSPETAVTCPGDCP